MAPTRSARDFWKRLGRWRDEDQDRFRYRLRLRQPMPMILMVSVHPSRLPDLLTPQGIRFDPPISEPPVPGRLRQHLPPHRGAAGPPDDLGRLHRSGYRLAGPGRAGCPADPGADLPDDVLVYLLGSRYCDTDKLSQTAWSLFAARPRDGAASRRSSTTRTSASASTTCAPTRPGAPMTDSCSERACAATSRTWPSPSAAA